MPSSTWIHTSQVCQWIWEIKPASVLDVGCGFGRWGFLAREICDIFHGRYDQTSWRTKIDAVEIYLRYITPLHRLIYDEIHVADALWFFQNAAQAQVWDLVMMGDVVEHFEKSAGLELIEEAKAHAKNVIISIPIGDKWPQKACLGNEQERHLSVWCKEDFAQATVYQEFVEPIKKRPYGLILWRGL